MYAIIIDYPIVIFLVVVHLLMSNLFLTNFANTTINFQWPVLLSCVLVFNASQYNILMHVHKFQLHG